MLKRDLNSSKKKNSTNSRKVCTHQMILKEVWGTGYGSEAHYLRVYAHRLRRKLGDAGRLLHTQPGIGYELLEE